MKDLWFERSPATQGQTLKDKLKIHLWYCVDTLLFKTSLKALSCWRIFLLRLFGAKIGKGCYVSPKCTVVCPWNVKIGNFSSIDDYAFIKPGVGVAIGDYVSISVFVHIIADGHDVRKRNFAYLSESVQIGNGVFIGADSYIGKGVSIGRMAVIGARSMVLKDIPENCIAFGTPCAVRSERLPHDVYSKFRYGCSE